MRWHSSLRTDQGLDSGKLTQVLQQLVQRVPGVRCDGVLVLEEELSSENEESVAKEHGEKGGLGAKGHRNPLCSSS